MQRWKESIKVQPPPHLHPLFSTVVITQTTPASNDDATADLILSDTLYGSSTTTGAFSTMPAKSNNVE